MKILAALLLLLAMGALTLGIKRRLATTSCPDPARGETEEDCPWAGLARKAERAESHGKPVLPVIRSELPALYGKMLQDSKRSDWIALWGQSINYDEYAKGVVVQPALIRAFEKIFGAGPYASWTESIPSDRIVHAGIEHTYGYLFSNLRTPFGFKRARWVRPTLDEGFGFPQGTLSPIPRHGTLFSNVTYFIGRIAFRDEIDRLRILEKGKSGINPVLADFAYRELKVTRLVETVDAPIPDETGKSRLLRIRTDFVPFLGALPGDGDSHLLIYSVDDPASGGAKLITAFPVRKSFVEAAMRPEGLGAGKPVLSRYNGYIAGLSGHPLTGKRDVRDYR